MILQELIKIVCDKCYNEFILTNNKNNDKIYGTALKLTDNPIIKEEYRGAFEDLQDICGIDHGFLCLELDRTQDLVLLDYCMTIGRLEYDLSSAIISIARDTIIIGIHDVTLTISCRYVPERLVASMPLFPLEKKQWAEITELLKEDYIDETRSSVENDKITLLIDTYALGNLNKNQISNLQYLYFELLNIDKLYEILDCGTLAVDYNRAATPYIMYDKLHKKCFIGLWSLQENKCLSKFNADMFYKKSYIEPLIINLCNNFEKREKIATLNISMFGNNLGSLEILR